MGYPAIINVNKQDYKLVHSNAGGGSWSIVETMDTDNVVWGGNPDNEGHVDELVASKVYAEWDGELTYCGKMYGYEIEMITL